MLTQKDGQSKTTRTAGDRAGGGGHAGTGVAGGELRSREKRSRAVQAARGLQPSSALRLTCQGQVLDPPPQSCLRPPGGGHSKGTSVANRLKATLVSKMCFLPLFPDPSLTWPGLKTCFFPECSSTFSHSFLFLESPRLLSAGGDTLPFQTYDTIPDPIGPCKVSVSLKPAVEGREIMSSRIRNLESQNNILQTRIDITFNTAELAAFHITAVSWGECLGLTDASQEKRLAEAQARGPCAIFWLP